MSTEPSRVLRFQENGEPLDVLLDEQAEVADPPSGSIRVHVIATGLNPADWALTTGFLPGPLPRGVGYDVAGVVESIGDGVAATHVGDVVFGSADLSLPSAGVAELAILNHWAAVPTGLDPVQAATLPMVAITTAWTLDVLDLQPGTTLLVNGAGGMVGYAMVQIALRRGLKVIATAGPAFTRDLEAFGAQVTAYGDGIVERVRAITGGAGVDFVLDASRANSGSLGDFVALTGGDPQRVMTISNHAGADELGARVNLRELRTAALAPADEVFAEFGELAARGEFHLPIAEVFPFDRWRDAVERSVSGHPHGKLVLLAPPAA
ncbi:NADP-dependent oxidoreductase [Gryllotalpicola protaetiae]|uniref:NADP-dependent oxidoreductase n=1 Tax=Gryllotalpicola protaetiae TaxID=2419771 RepID=A0A387BIF6_9MICO|nr:NADP-dependent oxidoreductase [Gryllotalpicola protaetiae]AYG03845.1 NADP-dependent oxidoreductase [Gryllotalpicola protaetiae]